MSALAKLSGSMSSHPNRGGKALTVGASPAPREVVAAREAAGLTQSESAAKIHGTLRAWQAYEDDGPNGRRMHPGLFELFLIKTGQPTPR